MGVSYLAVSTASTILSLIGLQCWTEISLEKFKSDGLISGNNIYTANITLSIELLLRSHVTISLLAVCAVNIFGLLILSLKTLFFGELVSSETRKLVERLVNYVIYKGVFLPFVIPLTVFNGSIWLTWLTVLCSLKMFQALARDRLERLNASPSATPWTYFHVYSALLLVFVIDAFCPVLWIFSKKINIFSRGSWKLISSTALMALHGWLWLCVAVHGSLDSSTFWLSLFEPLSIAFETLQAIVIHGFQLLDIGIHHSSSDTDDCQRSKFLDTSSSGALWEWRSNLVRNLGFFLDMMALLMALGHYAHIWWLHGMTVHVIVLVLFLNIRALVFAMVNRIRGFIRLRKALGTLHGALPDATFDEIQAYDDECAICRLHKVDISLSFRSLVSISRARGLSGDNLPVSWDRGMEPMAKAKKLPCNHLFHLACLRSWLDQGMSDMYSCPTCRKPLFVGRNDSEGNQHPAAAAAVSNDERLARQLSAADLDQVNAGGQAGSFPHPVQNALEASPWRGAGVDSNWLHRWPNQDGAGPSSGARSAGLGRMQMMMRHLASVGETYAQTALEDTSWSLWPTNPSQATTSDAAAFPPTAQAFPGGGTGVARRRVANRPPNDSIANLLAMAETVREVLPHIPDELIFQELQRTNSVTVAVNNLLQM